MKITPGPKRDLHFKSTGSLGILHRMESLIGEDREGEGGKRGEGKGEEAK